MTGAGKFSVASTLAIKASTTAPKLLVVTGTGNLALVGTSP